METLPNEILIYLFSFLSCEEFLCIPLLNKRMSDLSESDYFWIANYDRNFPGSTKQITNRKSYITFYRTYYKFIGDYFTTHIFLTHHPATSNQIYYVYHHLIPPFDITSLGILQPDVVFLKPSIFYYTFYRDYLSIQPNDWIMIERKRGDKSYSRKIIDGECHIVKEEHVNSYLPRCSYFLQHQGNIPIEKLLYENILQVLI